MFAYLGTRWAAACAKLQHQWKRTRESALMRQIKNLLKKLRGRVLWGIFTGVVQALARFIADAVGWPAAIVWLVLTGGAAVLTFITNVPAEWIWFAAIVTLSLGIPPAIRASADHKRASAGLIRAASGRQKLDQAEMGLRGPKAARKLPDKSPTSTERLERLFDEGNQLLKRDKSTPAPEWRQKIIIWFDQSEAAVKDDALTEAFMFRTVCRRPSPDEKFDDCPVLLAARLVKLRRIIGRMLADTEVQEDDSILRQERALRISGIYAEGVKVRNRAASLQALDAAAQAEMDELQEKLVEQIREIAPERAINLDTLNSYDPGDHPTMKLDDPKRALEFSELLLRVKKILAEYQ